MTSISRINRQWTVAARPDPHLGHEHFGYRETVVPELCDQQVLLQTHYLNVAPVMRMYMQAGGAGTEKPLELGEVIHGRGVAEVIESRHPEYPTGQFVHGQTGWQTFKVSNMTREEKMVRMQANGLPAWYGLTALGMTGYSAWCGLVSRGQPEAGDGILVSGAAGGVGSLVVQIAKALGCEPVVGLAGTGRKCEIMLKLGADHMINYRDSDWKQQIASAFPDGLDIYFDNVGGQILEAALDNLSMGARVVLCGSISEYTDQKPFGPRNYTRLRASDADMRGFFVYNHQSEFAQAGARMADWIKSGQIEALVDFSDGFETLPEALMGLYSGSNTGKRIVRVNPGDNPVC